MSQWIYAVVGEEARKAAVVRTGRDPGRVVTLDLKGESEEVRSVLAAHAGLTGKGRDYTSGSVQAELTGSDGTGKSYVHTMPGTVPVGVLALWLDDAEDVTPAACVAALGAKQRESEAETKADAEAEAKRQAELEAMAEARVQEALTAEVGDLLVGPPTYVSWRVERSLDDPRLADRLVEAEAEALRRNESDKSERVAEKAAEEKAKAEAEAERDKWILAHGSTRLQRILSEELIDGSAGAYRDERLALERPGWVWERETSGNYDDIRNPGEQAFELLDWARRDEPEAKLVYWRADHEGDEDCHPCDECPRYDRCEPACIADYLGREIVIFGEGAGVPA